MQSALCRPRPPRPSVQYRPTLCLKNRTPNCDIFKYLQQNTIFGTESRPGAYTPYKPWSKCSIIKLGGCFSAVQRGGEVDIKLWHKLGPIPTSPVQGERLYLGHNLYQLPEGWTPLIFRRSGGGAVDINYDLNYTNSPLTAARISWAYPQGGRLGGVPQTLVKGTHIQMPPNYWAQYLHFMVYSLWLSGK